MEQLFQQQQGFSMYNNIQNQMNGVQREMQQVEHKIGQVKSELQRETVTINQQLSEIGVQISRLQMEYNAEQMRGNYASSKLQSIAKQIHKSQQKYAQLRQGTKRYFKLSHELQNLNIKYTNLVNKYYMVRNQYS